MRRFLLASLVCALFMGCGDDGSGGGGVPGGSARTGGANAPGGAGDGQEYSGTDRDRWPSAELRRLQPGHEPTPFSAKQIARACGPKSMRVLRMEMVGGDPSWHCWSFTDQTSEGATFHDAACDAAGKEVGEISSKAVTWKGLQGHASWPANTVTTSEAQVTVPAGTFDCMHYVVKRTARQGEAEDRYWFAWELPGPPVRLERFVGGELKFTMTLVKVAGVGDR